MNRVFPRKPTILKAVTEHYDVFLSHNSHDKTAVVALAKKLKAQGVKVWLDLWEQRPGQLWQEALEQIIETVKTAAVLVGRDGLGPWENVEMRACLDEFVRRKLRVVPVLLPDCPKKPDLPLLLRSFTWVDIRDGKEEEGFYRLIWGITGIKPNELDGDANVLYEKTPPFAESPVIHEETKLIIPHIQGSPDEQVQALQCNIVSENIKNTEIWKHQIHDILRQEVPKQLNKIKPSDRNTIQRQGSYLRNIPIYKKQALPCEEDEWLKIPELLFGGHYPLGNVYELLGNDEIIIQFPSVLLGLSAILFYLRDKKKCHKLILQYNYPHALSLTEEIVKLLGNKEGILSTPPKEERILSTLPEVCAVADGLSVALTNLPKEPFYRKAMCLPPSEHRTIRPYSTKNKFKKHGICYIPIRDNIISTPFLYSERLSQLGHACRMELINIDPAELPDFLNSGENGIFSYVWTPHWNVFEKNNICDVLPVMSNGHDICWYNVFLMFNDTFKSDKRAHPLIAAISDAWLTLRKNPEELDAAISCMLADEDYLHSLYLSCGSPKLLPDV